MKPDNQSQPHQLTLEDGIQVGKELNLLDNPRFQKGLRELQYGRLRKGEEEELLELIADKRRKIALSGLLVPPPSESELSEGDLSVGESVDPEGSKEVRTSLSPPTPILVIGSPGVGKTTLVLLIVAICVNSIPIIIIDPRDDYTCLARLFPETCLIVDAENLPLNIFAPDPGVSIEANSSATVSTLADTLTMYIRGQNVLQDAINEVKKTGKTPTLRRVLAHLLKNPDKYSGNKSAYDSVVDRLQALDLVFGDAWNVEQGVTVPDLCRYRLVIVRTQGLGRTDLRVAYATLLQTRVFLFLRAQGQRTNTAQLLMVFEEAEYLLSKHRESGAASVGTMKEITHQARAVGLQLLFLLQDPTAINSSYLNDSGNVFVFRLSEGKAQVEITRSLGLPMEAMAQIGTLPDRHCYCRLNLRTCRRPFVMTVHPVAIDDTPLSREELEQHQQQYPHLLEFQPADEVSVLDGAESAAEAEPEWTNDDEVSEGSFLELSPEERYFLQTVDVHGCRGITAVYEVTTLSPSTGKKYLERFLDRGLVGTHTLVLPGRSGQRTTSFLTQSGRDLLQIPTPKGIGGDNHTAYQKEFAYALRELGCEVFVERSIQGKSADIVHRYQDSKGVTRLNAIEIEISTDGLSNLQKNLAAGFAETWLIVACETGSTLVPTLRNQIQEVDQSKVFITTTKEFLRQYAKHWEELKS